MGCTEPIAIAYAAARAKEVLGSLPEKCKISVSGNIIKNAKSVVVPHTNGMRGIEVALIAGIISGDSSAKLEVLSRIGKDKISLIGELREKLPIELCVSDSDNAFDIAVTLISGADSSFVRILGRHTNVVLVKKNDEVIYEGTDERENEKKHTALSVAEIVEFADTVDIGDV